MAIRQDPSEDQVLPAHCHAKVASLALCCPSCYGRIFRYCGGYMHLSALVLRCRLDRPATQPQNFQASSVNRIAGPPAAYDPWYVSRFIRRHLLSLHLSASYTLLFAVVAFISFVLKGSKPGRMGWKRGICAELYLRNTQTGTCKGAPVWPKIWLYRDEVYLQQTYHAMAVEIRCLANSEC